MRDRVDPVKEKLVEVRRGQILDAAVKVFAAEGFHNAKMKDVAKAAGVSNGTVYNYFKSKTDLLMGLLDRMNETEDRPEHFAAAMPERIEDFMVPYLRHRIELLWPNIDMLRAVIPVILSDPSLAKRYYEEMIAPGFALSEAWAKAKVADGSLREMDVELTMRSIAATLLGLLVLQMLGDEVLDERWKDLPEVISSLFLKPLVTGADSAKDAEEKKEQDSHE